MSRHFIIWAHVDRDDVTVVMPEGLPVTVSSGVELRNPFRVGLDRHGVFTDPQGSLVCTLCGPGPCPHTERVQRSVAEQKAKADGR